MVGENQIIPWQGVYFLTNTVLQKSLKHNVVMKNIINTIGKKTHALVKEKTLHCHEIRQESSFTQRSQFAAYHCVFFPAVVRNW